MTIWACETVPCTFALLRGRGLGPGGGGGGSRRRDGNLHPRQRSQGPGPRRYPLGASPRRRPSACAAGRPAPPRTWACGGKAVGRLRWLGWLRPRLGQPVQHLSPPGAGLFKIEGLAVEGPPASPAGPARRHCGTKIPVHGTTQYNTGTTPATMRAGQRCPAWLSCDGAEWGGTGGNERGRAFVWTGLRTIAHHTGAVSLPVEGPRSEGRGPRSRPLRPTRPAPTAPAQPHGHNPHGRQPPAHLTSACGCQQRSASAA